MNVKCKLDLKEEIIITKYTNLHSLHCIVIQLREEIKVESP